MLAFKAIFFTQFACEIHRALVGVPVDRVLLRPLKMAVYKLQRTDFSKDNTA